MSRKRRRREKRSVQNPAKPLTVGNLLNYVSGGARSSSGLMVSPRTALMCSPVWAAVDLITSDVAKLPRPVKQLADDGRTHTIEKSHPVHRVLNRWTGRETSDVWLTRMLGHALLYGNSYAHVLWRGSRVTGLHWYRRDQVEPYWEKGQLVYLVQRDTKKDGDGSLVRIQPDDMIHLHGLSLDEYGGLSIVDFARNTIGRHLSGEHYTDDFFANDATPSGWFEHPDAMSEQAQERFMSRVVNRHSGAGNRHKFGILEEGMKFNAIGISPRDAMLVELLDWSVKDVARFFSIPPHKLGDASKANYNSLEQENQAYFDSTLGKWVSRIEAEINYKMFLDSEIDAGYYMETAIDRLRRADTQTRFSSYAIALQWGIMSRNEVRQLEGLNPYEGGDDYLTPTTHAVVGDDPPPAEETLSTDPPPVDGSPDDMPEADSPVDDERSKALLRDLVRDRISAAARLLGNSAARAAKRDANYLAAINQLEDRHDAAVRGMVSPAVAAVRGRQSVDAVTRALFARAAELFVEASECSADRLSGRVGEAAEQLQLFAGDLATDLVYPRGKGNGTTSNKPAGSVA